MRTSSLRLLVASIWSRLAASSLNFTGAQLSQVPNHGSKAGGRRTPAPSTTRAVMFTIEQRDAIRERVLTLADQDPRVVAGAAIGSLAFGGGDAFSDL